MSIVTNQTFFTINNEDEFCQINQFYKNQHPFIKIKIINQTQKECNQNNPLFAYLQFINTIV